MIFLFSVDLIVFFKFFLFYYLVVGLLRTLPDTDRRKIELKESGALES